MSNFIGKEAKYYLDSLHRINRFEEHIKYTEPVFLLPENIGYSVNDDSTVKTFGLSPELDKKTRDLIRPIISKNALNLHYEITNVYTPLTYAESLTNILWHITTQAIIYTRVTKALINWINKISKKVIYGKHPMDDFWLSCSRPVKEIEEGDYICIFNRRVGGWDGSVDRPVIELLGAGGHLPSVWDSDKKQFRTLTIEENLQKEAEEELHLQFEKKCIHVFGGYNNNVTHELVILAGIEISAELLPDIQSFAQNNIEQDTMGLYLGTFSEVMNYYRANPEYFAGGKKAAPTNFPFCKELMNIVETYFLKRGIID